ncbi:MAG: presenilin family intramembrane aspartyl protease PSH, partial [Halorubrum sp.]
MFPREYRGVAFVVGLFLVVQLGALALVPEFAESGYQAVENPDDPTNSVVYVLAILAMTGVMLAAFKYNFDGAIRLLIVGVSAWLSWYVFSALVPPLAAAVPAMAVGVALLVHPEWYVIDTAGVLMGAGAAGLFGISFGLLPALILLAVLAVYDAISVYGTEHMLSLAEGVMDLNIPV